MKAVGNKIFKKKKYEKARTHFGKVIEEIEREFTAKDLKDPKNNHIKVLYYQLHTNKALCSSRLNDFSAVIKDCNKVLHDDPKN